MPMAGAACNRSLTAASALFSLTTAFAVVPFTGSLLENVPSTGPQGAELGGDQSLELPLISLEQPVASNLRSLSL